MASSPPPPSRPAARVLLVAPRSPARKAARAALRALALTVEVVADPYAATARFVQRPADLVLLSLKGLRRQDLAFVRMVKRRAPRVVLVLLVPDGRRERALEGLEAGADATLAEPFYEPEVRALVQALLRARPSRGARSEGPMTAALAAEVAHNVNNPLQILGLLSDANEIPAALRQQLGAELGRIRGVMDLLADWGYLGEMRRGPLAAGSVLRTALGQAVQAGEIAALGTPPLDGPPVQADEDHLRAAFGALIGFLVGRAGTLPLPVAARLRRTSGGGRVEVALRGRGVHLKAGEERRLVRMPLVTREATRDVHPGLALPSEVARLHGGRLIVRPARQGTVLTGGGFV